MNRITAIVLAVLLCAPMSARADDYAKALVAIQFALATLDAPSPPPAPPSPSGDKCDNCKGRGKLGDGTVSTICPVCGGTGKKKVQAQQVYQQPVYRTAPTGTMRNMQLQPLQTNAKGCATGNCPTAQPRWRRR